MRQSLARRLAGVVLAVAAGSIVTSVGVGISLANTPGDLMLALWALSWLGFPVVGAIIVTHQTDTRIGWVLLGIGVGVGVGLASLGYAELASRRDWPAAEFGAWLGYLSFVPAFGLIPFLILLFPRDRIPSGRWRLIAKVAGATLVADALAWATRPRLEIQANTTAEKFTFANPVGVRPLADVIETSIVVFGATLFAFGVAVAAHAVWRFRRARGDERQQLKWFASAAVMFPAIVVFIAVVEAVEALNPSLTHALAILNFVISFNGMAVAIGVAILKYRLYDIDVVISKTVVFAGLAGFITAVYVAIVVGIGSLIGAGDEPNLALSIVATAVVAVAFQPARERLTRLANRLVYGRRATPYEVLSRFSSQLGVTLATEQTLGHMARLLADGTGAARAQVWLKVGEQMRSAASWPADAVPDFAPLVLADGSLPPFAEVDVAVPVSHDGQLLGALTLTKKRGEPVTPTERKLVEDLAAQAGLVLRNVGLTAQLQARLEDLRESRRRLVEAQDQERRRLERDLHDGAQQQLIALKLKLSLAKTLAERHGATTTVQLLDQLAAETDEAVATLRDLAHGIYPPLLAAEGLPEALAAQARKTPIPVAVVADGVGRYPPEVEAAVYFCVLEAVQNVVKYAHASQVTVRLAHTDSQLVFTVADDGLGFDPATTPRGHGLTNMTDRLDALGGDLSLSSTPGVGTSILGTVPVSVTDSIGALA